MERAVGDLGGNEQWCLKEEGLALEGRRGFPLVIKSVQIVIYFHNI